MKSRLIRITTIPLSLKVLLKGQHRFMSENGFDVLGVSSKGEELQEVKDSEGIAVYELAMTRTISPIKDVKALWNFYKLCKKEKPHIVHSHTPKAGIVGMLGAKLAGVPIRLHTVAGMPLMETKGLKRRILEFVEKLTYFCATKIYPNSTVLYDFILENNYVTREKLKVIAKGSSNGINMSYFSSSQIEDEEKQHLKMELNIQQEDFVFIFVGRLVGDKGINELVKAFSELNTPKIKLILVGGEERELDPLKPETIAEIERNENIYSVGFQKDVRPYFAVSDALVFPSYREGFPNVVMQAGAMGLPSIVSNINGCNEIIVDGENGLIVPVKSVVDLTNAMQKILDNSELYAKLQANSRRMIEERYEQSVVWNALLEEYRLLLNKEKNNY